MKPSWERQDSKTPREERMGRGMMGSGWRDSINRKRERERRDRARGARV